jgi:hypothetical protein
MIPPTDDDDQIPLQEADQPEVNRRAMAAGRYYRDKGGKLWINGKPVENPPLPKPRPSQAGAGMRQPKFDGVAKDYVK